MITFDLVQFDRYSLQEIHQWLDRVTTGQEQVPNNFDWHMFGYLANNKFLELDVLDWARLALRGYELQWQFLASKSDDLARLRILQPAMRLRAHLIAENGPNPIDPLFDLNAVIRWAEGWLTDPQLQGASINDPTTLRGYGMRKMVLEAIQPLVSTRWLNSYPLLLHAAKQNATP